MRTLATGRCSLNLSDFIVPLTPSYIGEKVSGITGLQNHFRAALQCLLFAIQNLLWSATMSAPADTEVKDPCVQEADTLEGKELTSL